MCSFHPYEWLLRVRPISIFSQAVLHVEIEGLLLDDTYSGNMRDCLLVKALKDDTVEHTRLVVRNIYWV